MASCQCSTGNWLVTMVELVRWRSSKSSSRCCCCDAVSFVSPQSSSTRTLDASQLLEQFDIATVALGGGQVLKQPRQPVVADREALPAGLVCQRTCHVALADAGGAGDDDVLVSTDPVASGQSQHEAPVEAASATIVEILQTGRLPQPSPSQAGLDAIALAHQILAIHQQAEPLHEVQFIAIGLCQLFAQGGSHAGKAKLFEFVKGGMS